jgi:hypothetical protein
VRPAFSPLLTALSLSLYICIRSATAIRDLVVPNATATAKRTWELGLDNTISRARPHCRLQSFCCTVVSKRDVLRNV